MPRFPSSLLSSTTQATDIFKTAPSCAVGVSPFIPAGMVCAHLAGFFCQRNNLFDSVFMAIALIFIWISLESIIRDRGRQEKMTQRDV